MKSKVFKKNSSKVSSERSSRMKKSDTDNDFRGSKIIDKINYGIYSLGTSVESFGRRLKESGYNKNNLTIKEQNLWNT